MKNFQFEIKSRYMFILDDDKFFLEFMKEKIKKELPWVKLKVFTDRKQLISQMCKKPDLILLDYNLGTENLIPINAHSVLVSIYNINPNQNVVFISDEKTSALLDEYRKYRNIEYVLKSQSYSNDFLNILSKNM